MNLKGIMQTLGARPGQVMSDPYARAWAPTPSPIKEAEGEDHEVSMAQNSLDTIIKMATELKAKMGENEKDIPAWIQDHITNSENFISQASSNYHEYSTNEAGINGAPRFPSLDGTANESVNEGKTYSNKFAAWFTGTVLNTVKHPTYGKHQLTADQIEKSSGDYKNKLFKAIELAVKNGDITPDVIRKNESLRLTKLK